MVVYEREGRGSQPTKSWGHTVLGENSLPTLSLPIKCDIWGCTSNVLFSHRNEASQCRMEHRQEHKWDLGRSALFGSCASTVAAVQ